MVRRDDGDVGDRTLDRRIVLRLLGPGPGRLLDLGCGTGAHTHAFAGAGWSTVGVDVSADQLLHVEEPADDDRDYPYRLAFVARR